MIWPRQRFFFFNSTCLTLYSTPPLSRSPPPPPFLIFFLGGGGVSLHFLSPHCMTQDRCPPAIKLIGFLRHWQEERFFFLLHHFLHLTILPSPPFPSRLLVCYSRFIYHPVSVLIWSGNVTRIHDNCLCYVPLEPFFLLELERDCTMCFQRVWLRTSTIVVAIANRGPAPVFFFNGNGGSSEWNWCGSRSYKSKFLEFMFPFGPKIEVEYNVAIAAALGDF